MKTKQSIPKELRYTVAEFNREFPNDDACLEYIKSNAGRRDYRMCEV